jgi:phosphatidylethanolamine-binding protein (PEBP) family uncharacterized protein
LPRRLSGPVFLEGTKSLALFFKDLTLAEQGKYEWISLGNVGNIPITITGMPEGLGDDAKPTEMGGAEQKSAAAAMPGGGGNKFFGPCPSMGTRTTDTYAFILYAFEEEQISPPTNTLVALDGYFEDHATATTSISVTSDSLSTDF